jgi:hypothetical protein
MNDFGIIKIKLGNEFWLILFREYISPKLFAVNMVDKIILPFNFDFEKCRPKEK